MMRRLALSAMLLLVGCQSPRAVLSVAPVQPDAGRARLPMGGTAAAGLGRAAEAVPGQALVRLEPGNTPEAFFADARLARYTRKAALRLRGSYLLKVGVPEGMTFAQVRDDLAGVGGIASIVPDYVARPLAAVTPDDPDYGEQWAHREAFADTTDAWARVDTAAQAQVIVAVLDTGMDVSHPEFTGRVVNPTDYSGEGADATDVTDLVGHGTHVAGIIGAAGDNGMGVAGVAWNCKIMPMKVLGGQAGTFDIVRAMLAAIAYRDPANAESGPRVRVINMSLGAPTGAADVIYADAVAEAREAGVVVVAAAGNDGRDVVNAPASTPGVLAVGSTGHYLDWETLSPFSNFGPRLDLVAPGEAIRSTTPLAGSELAAEYDTLSGTSMASPYVAGVAALVVAEYDPDHARAGAAFADKVRARLLAATDDMGAPGPDPLYGAGRLDAAKAVAPATLD